MSPKPIKIAVVCSTLNQLGGPAAHIRNLYNQLNNTEFHFTLILCSQNEAALRDFMLEGGVKIQDMIFIPHAKKKTVLPFVFTLRDIFHREKFDIVHAFETQTQVLAGWAASWAEVKNFVAQCEAQFLPSTISFSKRILFRILNSFLKDYFTKTVVVSNGLCKELIENDLRPKNKIQVIHPGIKVSSGERIDFSYRGLSAGAPVIGAVSRLSVEKGLDRFIQTVPYVLKSIPAAKFVICGDGIEKEPLRLLALSLGIEKSIEFKPWVKDVPQVLRELEVFVMPSHREGLPITLLEAMSLGRLSVASDIEGIRDVINNGIDGILVNTSDICAFADAIILVCSDHSKAASMGRAAMERVRAEFNIEREAGEIKELYEEIVGC